MPTLPLLQSIDAVTIPVPNLDAGLSFYRDRLGHQIRWRNDAMGQAGLGLPGSESEIVLATGQEYEPNWLVSSVDEAAEVIAAAGDGWWPGRRKSLSASLLSPIVRQRPGPRRPIQRSLRHRRLGPGHGRGAAACTPRPGKRRPCDAISLTALAADPAHGDTRGAPQHRHVPGGPEVAQPLKAARRGYEPSCRTSAP